MRLNNTFLALVALVLVMACDSSTECSSRSGKKGLVKVSILYPSSDGSSFDMDYYTKKHMPMIDDLFGEALLTYSVSKGISGRTGDETAPYLASVDMYFESVASYEAAFGPNAAQILGDIKNYTDIQPVVQISEVID